MTRVAHSADTRDRAADKGSSGLVSLIVSMVVFGPAFLISCLVVDVNVSFSFGPLDLGIILSLFWASGAFASILAGLWVDRLGARFVLFVAALLTAASAFGSGVAQSWHMLMLMFVIGGSAAGMAGPAAVRLVISAVAPEQRAMAIALRQSAAPVAAILTGLFAATAQGHVGWRLTFTGLGVIAGAIAVLALLLGREGTAIKRAPDAGSLRVQTVALLICGAAFLGAAVSSFSGFVVTTGIGLGMSPHSAALLLAGSSGAAILARLASGWAADKRAGGHLARVAALLMLGSVSCIAVGLAQGPAFFIPAIVAVSMTAWSSNALYTYAVVNRQAHAPAKATSIVQLGTFAGSAIGPFLFGFTTEHMSARIAWLFLALWLMTASAIVVQARRTFSLKATAVSND